MSKKMRIAVGVSGGGRSLANLIQHESKHPYSVAFIFSSSESAKANAVAQAANRPLLVLDFSRKNFEQAKSTLYESLEAHSIDLVVLAGFMRLLPVDSRWQNKIINIHPALLPNYGGRGMHGHFVHEAVIAAQEVESGATVHFVNENYDEGSLISQSKVHIAQGESAESLAAKVFKAECGLLPWTLSQMAAGCLPAKDVVLFDQGRDFH
jgi:folate-dependent phosphoribosylglycinamide formyltransferase PurN